MAKAVRDHLDVSPEIEDAALITTHVVRVEIQPDQLLVELAEAKAATSKSKRKQRTVIGVPWRKTPSTRRREVLVPETGSRKDIDRVRGGPGRTRTSNQTVMSGRL